VATVPNAISALRLLMVPAFAYLVLQRQDVWAVAVLAASGVTDWLDGVAARKLNQYSRLGELLDPAVDRAFILVTVVLLAWRGVIPWLLVVALVLRELVVGLALLALRFRGVSPPKVVFVGKAATLGLMYAFPLLLLGSVGGPIGRAANIVGWAFALWGVGLYWFSGGAYLLETWRTLRWAKVEP
jgi:cardiolipin synthase